MAVNPVALVSLAVAVSVAAVGTYVFFRNPSSRLTRVYLWLSFVLFCWNLFQFVYRSVQTYEVAYVWMKAAVFFGPLVAPSLLHFVLAFADSRRILSKPWFYVVNYGPSVLICAVWGFTDRLIAGPVRTDVWFDTYATGNRALLVASMAWLLLLSAIVVGRALMIAVARARTQAETVRKRQARLIMVGVAIMFAATFTTELVMRGLGLEPVYVGTWGAGIVALLIGYAIVRHELFALNPATAAESIVATMTDSLVIADPDARILTANPATTSMLGCTEADLLGQPVALLFPEEERVPELVAADAEDPPVRSREVLFAGRDGLQIPVLLSRSPIFSKNGIFAGSVYVAQDITRIRELTRELQAANDELEARVQERTAELVEAEGRLADMVVELQDLLDGVVEALSSTTSQRDPYTTMHQKRVARLAVAIAEDLGLDEKTTEGLRIAALLHDIGKISVPSEILSKPGRLTEIEMSIVRSHATVGYELLKPVAFPRPIAEAVSQHHERLDGSGYPDGLHGDEQLLEARILAVADVVEAMASHRPYRPALGLEPALDELQAHSGVKYDARVVEACLRVAPAWAMSE